MMRTVPLSLDPASLDAVNMALAGQGTSKKLALWPLRCISPRGEEFVDARQAFFFAGSLQLDSINRQLRHPEHHF